MDRTDIPLICLPFSGAGPSFYHSWQKIAPPGIEVVPIQLPGKERLIDEDPYTDLHTAADGILPQVIEVAAGRPLAIFGHCLGSILAFELAGRLADRIGSRVVHLFASACRAPWNSQVLIRSGMPDDEFLDAVQRFTGYRHPALDIPEMRELLLPALRADFSMYEHYLPSISQGIDIPITAIYGNTDHLVPVEAAERWEVATEREFELVEMNGGHMYLVEEVQSVLALVAKTLSGYSF